MVIQYASMLWNDKLGDNIRFVDSADELLSLSITSFQDIRDLICEHHIISML